MAFEGCSNDLKGQMHALIGVQLCPGDIRKHMHMHILLTVHQNEQCAYGEWLGFVFSL